MSDFKIESMEKGEELREKYYKLTEPIIEMDKKIKCINGVEKYYRGIQILHSRLNYNPKILFLGINPGGGCCRNGKPAKDIEPMLDSVHLREDSKWTFAVNLKKLIKETGKEINFHSNIVFMNVFPFATDNETYLHKLFSMVKKQDILVYKECFKFLNEMVKAINPQIIVCLGKSAFDFFVDKNTNDCNDIIRTKDNLSCKYKSDIPVFGIRRNRSSFGSNDKIQKFAKQIAEKL